MLFASVIIAFILGSALGSFLNVLIDRLPRGETVYRGRSKCENCRRILKPYDLIPIVSYLYLRGKCRHCKAKIPLRLLLVEIFCGFLSSALLLYIFYLNLSSFQFIFLIFIFLSLTGIFITDIMTGIIPDEFIVAIIGAVLILLLIFYRGFIFANLITAFFSFLFFLTIFLVTRGRGMGFGDVKFAFAMGLFLGFPKIIVGMYAAFLTGMIISLILIVMKKKKLRGDSIPFGPFLVAGSVIAFFFGNELISIFLRL